MFRNLESNADALTSPFVIEDKYTEGPKKIRARLYSDLTPKEKFLTADLMAVAIEAQKEHAAKKGFTFNCFAFFSDLIDENTDELKNFLVELEKNKKNYPNNTRFQYLFFNNSHWSTADVQIINGELHFFLLDSADYVSSYKEHVNLIQKISPTANITSAALEIQKDFINCGLFSLDLAMGLAKIPNLHPVLASIPEQRLNPYDNNHTYSSKWSEEISPEHKKDYFPCLKRTKPKKIKYIFREELLKRPEFGSLFKLNQDASLETDGVMCRTKKSTLTAHIQQHLKKHINKKTGIASMRNKAVKCKRSTVIKRSKAYLESISEDQCRQVLENRQGKHFLASLLPKDHSVKNTDNTAKLACVNGLSRLSMGMCFFREAWKSSSSAKEDKQSHFRIVR